MPRGRPKGALNKTTLAALGKSKPVKAKGKRGRPPSTNKVVKVKGKRGRPVGSKKSVTNKVTLSPNLPEPNGLVGKLLDGIRILLKIQKAGFIDGWKQFHANVEGATPIQWLAKFEDSAAVLGVTAEDLENAVKEEEVTSEVPVEAPAPVVEDATEESCVVTAISEIDGNSLNVL